MNFRTFIETFDQPCKITWFDKSINGWAGKFVADKNEYLIMFEEHEDNPNIFEITFALDRSKQSGKLDYEYDLTGTGSYFSVFSTIIQAMKEFDQAKKPDGYVFNALTPGRKGFYNILIHKFLDQNHWYVQRDADTVYLFRRQLSPMKV